MGWNWPKICYAPRFEPVVEALVAEPWLVEVPEHRKADTVVGPVERSTADCFVVADKTVAAANPEPVEIAAAVAVGDMAAVAADTVRWAEMPALADKACRMVPAAEAADTAAPGRVADKVVAPAAASVVEPELAGADKLDEGLNTVDSEGTLPRELVLQPDKVNSAAAELVSAAALLLAASFQHCWFPPTCTPYRKPGRGRYVGRSTTEGCLARLHTWTTPFH